MFSLLSDYFSNTNGLFHILSYTTARCGFALVFSFLFTMFLMPKYIAFSKKWQFKNGQEGQPIRGNYLPEHLEKKGTPTMGGIMIILSTLFTCLVSADLTNYYILILMSSIVAFGILGFSDDYKKVHKKDVGGISAKTKMIFQFIVAFAIILITNYCVGSQEYASNLTFPFFRKFVLNLGFVYTIFRLFVIIGSSNAVNITDGMDGLAIIPIIFTSVVLMIFSYVIGNITMSNYLFFNYQSGVNEICIFLSSLIGAGIGFLWFNAKPAKIFMGDVGSLAIGGTLGVVAVMIKSEFVLAIAGGLFVLETLSVIIQVQYFKLTKGKRFFKMAPIHHHFQKSGWSETQVVIRFWIISFFFALLALASLKIR